MTADRVILVTGVLAAFAVFALAVLQPWRHGEHERGRDIDPWQPASFGSMTRAGELAAGLDPPGLGFTEDDAAWLASLHPGPDEPQWPPTRMADTGEIFRAPLAADVLRFMQAQDADVAAYLTELKEGLR